MAVTTHSYYHSCVKKVTNSDGHQFHTTINKMNNNLSPQISGHRKDSKGPGFGKDTKMYIFQVYFSYTMGVRFTSGGIWNTLEKNADLLTKSNANIFSGDRHCCISGCKEPITNRFSRKWMFHIKILPRQNRYSSKINLIFGYKQKQNKTKRKNQYKHNGKLNKNYPRPNQTKNTRL